MSGYFINPLTVHPLYCNPYLNKKIKIITKKLSANQEKATFHIMDFFSGRKSVNVS